MKKLILFSLISLLAITSSFADGETGIKFEKISIEEAFKKAKQEQKMVFIDAYTTWCGPCKYLSAKVFPDPQLSELYNTYFINIKVDMEKGDGIEFAKKHNVKAFPTLLFFRNDGFLLHRTAGVANDNPVGAVLALAERVIKNDIKLYGKLKEMYDDGDNSEDLLYNYLAAINDAGLDNKKIRAEYFATQDPSLYSEPKNWDLIRYDEWETNHPIFQDVLKNYAVYTKKHGEEKVNNFIAGTIESNINNLLNNESIAKTALETEYNKLKKVLEPYNIASKDKLIQYSDIQYFKKTKNSAKYFAAVSSYVSKNKDLEDYEINELSWSFYTMKAPQNYMVQAEGWMKKLVTDFPKNYHYLDTYAAILYGLKKKTLATEWANKAIKIGTENGDDVAETKAMLTKIKNLPK